jgi:hypothetical protein
VEDWPPALATCGADIRMRLSLTRQPWPFDEKDLYIRSPRPRRGSKRHEFDEEIAL